MVHLKTLNIQYIAVQKEADCITFFTVPYLGNSISYRQQGGVSESNSFVKLEDVGGPIELGVSPWLDLVLDKLCDQVPSQSLHHHLNG